MQGNIFAAPLDGVFLPEKVGPSGEFIEKGGPPILHPIHYLLILQKKTKECD